MAVFYQMMAQGGAWNGVRIVSPRMIDYVTRDFTGDMVDDGAKAEQWQQFFDIEAAQMRDNVYYPAVGNHDRQGRGRTADTYRAFFSVPDKAKELLGPPRPVMA